MTSCEILFKFVVSYLVVSLFLLELQLKRGKTISLIPFWPEEWFVSFKIQPHKGSISPSQYSSILHFTIDGNGYAHGFRCPAFFISPRDKFLHVVSTINEQANFVCFHDFIPFDVVTSVYMEQKSISSSGAHAVKIYINGTVVTEV